MKKGWLSGISAVVSAAMRGGPEEPRAPGPEHSEIEELRAALAEKEAQREELSIALNESEARRRQLQGLLDPPEMTDLSRWKDLADGWLTWAEENPEGGLDAPSVQTLARLVDTLVTRAAVLRNALDRDQTGLAHALARVVSTAKGYFWITEGRGSYAWNDDQYREETARALGAIMATAAEALGRSGTIATRAIRNELLPASAPISLSIAVNGLLIDDKRLGAVLDRRWGDIRHNVSCFSHHWTSLTKDERTLLLRTARVVLREALHLSDLGLEAEPAPPAGEPQG